MLDICISLSAGCTHWPWSPPFDTILLSCCHPIPSNWLFLFIVINITTESIFRQHNSTDWSSVAMAPFCLWRLQSRDVPGKLGLVIAIDVTEDAKMFSLFILTQSCSSALPVIQVCSMPQKASSYVKGGFQFLAMLNAVAQKLNTAWSMTEAGSKYAMPGQEYVCRFPLHVCTPGV